MPKSAEARRDPYPPDVPIAGWGCGSAYTCIYEYVEGNITVNKKLCLSTAALTLLSPFAAFADDPTGPTVWDGFSGFLSPDWSRDFSATVGVKVWINDWQRDSFISELQLRRCRCGGTPVVVLLSDTAPDNKNPTSSRSRSLNLAQIQVAVRDR